MPVPFVESLSDSDAFRILNALPGLGPVTMRRLLEAFGEDPRRVLGAEADILQTVRGVGPRLASVLASWSRHFDPEAEARRMESLGCRFRCFREPGYPPLLLETADPPVGLYQIGEYEFRDNCVAVVGSRSMSAYGAKLARALGEGLARAGFCVVSGLARGIDAEAHKGALDAGGVTAAVLGNGVDFVYPRENQELFRRIAREGVLLSEFPLGRRADRQSFAMRNRVVSGMSRVVVVVESDIDGGSMITARFAAEQGRTVCAVPGRVDQTSSRGCHRLIRDGATLVSGVEEVLEELSYLRGLTGPGPVFQARQPPPGLDPVQVLLWQALAGGAMQSPDALALATGLTVEAVSAALMLMELQGLAVRHLDGCYELG